MYEKINEIMKKEFIESKSPVTLEKYVMSEVLSPVGDYINVISILKENTDWENIKKHWRFYPNSKEFVIPRMIFLRSIFLWESVTMK